MKALGTLSFRTCLIVAFMTIWAVVTIPIFIFSSDYLKNLIQEERTKFLFSVATSSAANLTANLLERKREIELLAESDLFRTAASGSKDVKSALDKLQTSYPIYSWIGFADQNGIVTSAARGALTGVDVSKRPWYIEGKKGTFVGDLHEAVLLAKLLKEEFQGQKIQFIDFAAPVYNSKGDLRGVLASHVHWKWAGEVLSTLDTLTVQKNNVELFIVDKNQQIIFQNSESKKDEIKQLSSSIVNTRSGLTTWTDGERFLSVTVPVKEPAIDSHLGWKLVVRQHETHALSSVWSMQKYFIVIALFTGVLFLLFAWFGSDKFARPVESLVQFAQQIKTSRVQIQIEQRFLSTELQRLAKTLVNLSSDVIDQRNSLEKSKSELEARVAERTAQLEEMNVNLDRLARTDALTGLPNRLEANIRLKQEFARYKRSGKPFSACAIDIDFFKSINDKFGHATGDDVLKVIAKCLATSIRETDFVARVGGEEILVLLPDTPIELAPVLAEKLRKSIANTPFDSVGSVTVSIGVSSVIESDLFETDVIDRADQLLYKAKDMGRNQVQS